MIRLRCYTYFDITPTGIKSHFKASQIPVKTTTGFTINNMQDWHHARNQQRNWETINQIISLRTLPVDITYPVTVEDNGNKIWEFEFTVEQPTAIQLGTDDLGALYYDCNGVPMLTNLDETNQSSDVLLPKTNIVFEPAHNK
jgi:hypothetical protein